MNKMILEEVPERNLHKIKFILGRKIIHLLNMARTIKRKDTKLTEWTKLIRKRRERVIRRFK